MWNSTFSEKSAIIVLRYNSMNMINEYTELFSCRNTMLYWQHNETWAAPKQSQITYERHISCIREEPNGVFFHSTACLENKTQSLKVLPQWQVIFALFIWSFFSDSVLKSIVNRVFRVIWCLVLFVKHGELIERFSKCVTYEVSFQLAYCLRSEEAY